MIGRSKDRPIAARACGSSYIKPYNKKTVENRMNLSLRKVALAASCVLFAGQLMAEPKRPECIAPASPGGGFDLTCKLAQSALVNEKLLSNRCA